MLKLEKNWKFIFLIVLTINDYYHHQLINAAEQSLANLIKPIRYLIHLKLNPNVEVYSGHVTIEYEALKSFSELTVDGVLAQMQLIEPSNATINMNYDDRNRIQSIKFTRNHLKNVTYRILIQFNNTFNRYTYGIYKDVNSKRFVDFDTYTFKKSAFIYTFSRSPLHIFIHFR